MSVDVPFFEITESDDNFVKFYWTMEIPLEKYPGSPLAKKDQTGKCEVRNSTVFHINPYRSIKWQFNARFETSYEANIKLMIVLNADSLEDDDDYDVKAMLCYNILDSNSMLYKSSILKRSYSKSSTLRWEKHSISNAILDRAMVIEGHIVLLQSACEKNELELLHLSQLQRDLKETLKNKQFADVRLEVGDSTLHCHKLILSARSPVFRKMLDHGMNENSTNIVKITDVDKHSMEIFLLFLYTGNLEDLSFDTVISLYIIAEKYDVKLLQDTCRSLLASYLSVENVSSILKLSDFHNDERLKDVSVKFLGENFQKIYTTAEWKSLLGSDPSLASYALGQISSQVALM